MFKLYTNKLKFNLIYFKFNKNIYMNIILNILTFTIKKKKTGY